MRPTTPTSPRSRSTRSRSISIASICSFPEKRPFFLENAGLFSVGVGGEAEVFFSRAIGIGPDGLAIPIVGGARLSGRVAPRTSVGIINMQTAEEEVRGIPANNFSVARVQHELPNRSAVGAIFVNRQGDGRSRRRTRLQPQLCGRCARGIRTEWPRERVRRAHGDARPVGRPARVQHRRVSQHRKVAAWRRLHRGRRQLQSRSRVSLARQRLPQSGNVGEPEHPAAAGQPSGNFTSCGRTPATTRTGTSTVFSNRPECTSTSTGSSGRATSFTPA